MHTEHLVPASTAGALTPQTRPRGPRPLTVSVVSALAAATVSAAITWAVVDDGAAGRSTARSATVSVVDTEAVTRDLVERGLVPAQSLERADAAAAVSVVDTEAVTRDLVERGLVPAQSLADG